LAKIFKMVFVWKHRQFVLGSASGCAPWQPYRGDGTRFVVHAEEKLTIAAALPERETAPSRTNSVTSTYSLQCLTRSSSKRSLAYPITESSPIIMSSPLNGGAGFAGKSGRKTANACDTNAIEISAETAAHFIFVARNTFTKVSNIVVQ
jgi:hypothetical protein